MQKKEKHIVFTGTIFCLLLICAYLMLCSRSPENIQITNTAEQGAAVQNNFSESYPITVSLLSEKSEKTNRYVMADPTAGADYSGYHPQYGEYFWGQSEISRSSVHFIEFQNTISKAPAKTIDISKNQDKSILIWLDGDCLIVASDGLIQPDPDSGYLFAGFSKVENIRFNGCLDTSEVKNMAGFFKDCCSLRSVDIRCFQTEQVTDMHEMFSGCGDLANVDLTSFCTPNVTDMSEMFSWCRSLRTIDLSHLTTAKVTNMNSMFAHCISMRELDVHNFVTSSVTDISYMFHENYELEKLNVRGFDTRNVLNMIEVFCNCYNLRMLDLSTFRLNRDLPRPELIFSSCYVLESINAVDPILNDIYQEGCKNGSINRKKHFSEGFVSDVSMRTMGTEWYRKNSEYFWEQTKYRKDEVFTVTFDPYSSSMDSAAGAWDVSSKRDGSVMAWMEGNELIVGGKGRVLLPADSSYLFYNFPNLKQVFLSSENWKQVQNAQYMFAGSAIQDARPLRMDTYHILNMHGMFSNCKNLLEFYGSSSITYAIDKPDDVCSGFVLTNTVDTGAMFEGCSNLRVVDMSYLWAHNLRQMEHMFDGCSSLELAKLTGFRAEKVNGVYAIFNDCPNVQLDLRDACIGKNIEESMKV